MRRTPRAGSWIVALVAPQPHVSTTKWFRSQCRIARQRQLRQLLGLGAQRPARCNCSVAGHAHQVGHRRALQRQREALAQRRQVGAAGRARRHHRQAGQRALGGFGLQDHRHAAGAEPSASCRAVDRARRRSHAARPCRAPARTATRSAAGARAARRPRAACRQPAAARAVGRHVLLVERHGDAVHRLAWRCRCQRPAPPARPACSGVQRHLLHMRPPDGRTSGTGRRRSAAAPAAPAAGSRPRSTARTGAPAARASAGTRLASADAGVHALPGLGQHRADHAVLRRAHHELRARPRCSAASLRQRLRARARARRHALRLQRQLAALRLDAADLARQCARAGAPSAWRCACRPSSSSRLGLNLRRRDEVVGAQRLQPRQRLLGQRQALPLQRRLGVELRRLALHVVSAALQRRACAVGSAALLRCSAVEQAALARSQAALHRGLRVAAGTRAGRATARTARRRPAPSGLRARGARATVRHCGGTRRITPAIGHQQPPHMRPCACTRRAQQRADGDGAQHQQRRRAPTATAGAPAAPRRATAGGGLRWPRGGTAVSSQNSVPAKGRTARTSRAADKPAGGRKRRYVEKRGRCPCCQPPLGEVVSPTPPATRLS